MHEQLRAETGQCFAGVATWRTWAEISRICKHLAWGTSRSSTPSWLCGGASPCCWRPTQSQAGDTCTIGAPSQQDECSRRRRRSPEGRRNGKPTPKGRPTTGAHWRHAHVVRWAPSRLNRAALDGPLFLTPRRPKSAPNWTSSSGLSSQTVSLFPLACPPSEELLCCTSAASAPKGRLQCGENGRECGSKGGGA